MCCLFFAAFNQFIVAEKIPTEIKWEDCNDRSLPSIPVITKEGNTLFIFSDNVLEGVTISIANVDRKQIYVNLNCVTVDIEYTIPIDSLPTGNYQITVMQGNKHIIGWFQKD
ncbi:MAG: DUF3244 domain-containing protein [Phocaeicola sp.]|nr:DUF3244 domain-containing protein [Phocaeicola sp.]